MSIRPIAKLLYALNAAAFLAAGAGVLLLGTGLLPAGASKFIIDFAGGGDLTLHLVQEMATLLVLGGLVNLWCVLNYSRSLYFHCAMTGFWALFALVHWFDYHGVLHAGKGPVINTIPFGVFLIVGVMRRLSDRHAAGASGGSAA